MENIGLQNTNQIYRNTEVLRIFKRIDSPSEIMLQLLVNIPDKLKSTYDLMIDYEYRLKQQLKNILGFVKNRIYFTHGMENIDIFRSGGVFIIQHSPIDGVYKNFELKKGELEKVYECIKNEWM